MPYKVSTEGMEDLSRMLESLGDAGQGVAARALYEGAGVMANTISQAVHGIAVEPFKYAARGKRRKPSPEEKAVLVGSGGGGISKFRRNGLTVDTSVGYSNAGYANLTPTKVKPVALIANSINSGTSFMDKQPFFRKAVSRAKGPALAKIESEAQRITEELLNGGK